MAKSEERVLPPHSPVQLGGSPSRPRRPGCPPRAASGRPCGVTRKRRGYARKPVYGRSEEWVETPRCHPLKGITSGSRCGVWAGQAP